MSQSAAVSSTKQMSLEQPFKLSETGVDVLVACSIDVDQQTQNTNKDKDRISATC